ncbi:hypothetical protein WOLCODRAFT_159989 [Wolfiporia cocos MD-104 SS10]|uniref:C2H2-type domain-containing protein n=1 Tax=Wolfiporia cocos (strain MD-104) TaxID=742152 RepID=A0A2H3IUE0_WOLCO|nr:hypothetical protein WOLCODRAFT_159989 [Wolfiporia cocos MD-104 SS10]
MHGRAVGKPWTPEEDRLLTEAVAAHGEHDNWKTVALSVPGRTNKACRKRWLHSLSPSVKKSAWTPEEDARLRALLAAHGPRWAAIARGIPGRTDDACSKRYREALDPALRRGDWSAAEDAALAAAHARLGPRWGRVGLELGRSGLGCRNRWRMLERKKAMAAREGASHGEADAAPADAPRQPSEPAQAVWAGPSHPPQFWDPPSLPYGADAPGSSFSGYTPGLVADNAHFSPGSSMNAYTMDQSAPPPGEPYQYEPFPPVDHMSADIDYSLCHTQTPPFSPEHEANVIDPQLAAISASAEIPNNAQRNVIDHASPTTTAVPEQRDHSYAPPVHEDVTAAMSTSTLPGSSPRGSPQPNPVPSIPPPASAVSATTDTDDSGQSSSATQRALSTRHYRTAEEKARQMVPRRRYHKHGQVPVLSLYLRATDDVPAYACGHPRCWPADASGSSACYATSKELLNHNKMEHVDDMGGSTPFRCGLAGCKKSWKSINGLQYHLQMSKTHFQQALSTMTPPPAATTDSSSATAAATAPKTRKTFPCTRAGCGKQYKQLAGLQYHLAHGHPEEVPVQLAVIPPALARKVAEKTGRA